MNIGRKLTYAAQSIESILRHDDEPLVARTAAAATLKAKIDAELAAAGEREAERVKAALADTAEPSA